MSFTLPGAALANNKFGSPTDLDTKFAAIETALNALDDSNFSASAAIAAYKITNGGAVTEGEITTSGEANKIPKLDSTGSLVTNKIIFVDGNE